MHGRAMVATCIHRCDQQMPLMFKHNATIEHMVKQEQVKLKLIMKAQSCAWLFTSILAFRLPFTASFMALIRAVLRSMGAAPLLTTLFSAFTLWLSAVLGLNVTTIWSLIVTSLRSST